MFRRTYTFMHSASVVIFTVQSRGPRPGVKLGTLGPLNNGEAQTVLKERLLWLKKWTPNMRQDLSFCCSGFYFFTSEYKYFFLECLLFCFCRENGLWADRYCKGSRELTSLANFIHLCTPEINCRRETKPIHLPVF